MVYNKLTRYIFTIAILLSGYTVFTVASPVHSSHQGPGQHNDGYPNRNNNNRGPYDHNGDHNAPNTLKRVQEIKVAYITRQLDLNPTQNEKFWPVYNQYQSELLQVMRDRRASNGDNELFYQRKILNIRERYNNEFLKILPPDKVNMVYKSEKQFNDEAIRRLREHRNGIDNK
jgi:hypothetical protein